MEICKFGQLLLGETLKGVISCAAEAYGHVTTVNVTVCPAKEIGCALSTAPSDPVNVPVTPGVPLNTPVF